MRLGTSHLDVEKKDLDFINEASISQLDCTDVEYNISNVVLWHFRMIRIIWTAP